MICVAFLSKFGQSDLLDLSRKVPRLHIWPRWCRQLREAANKAPTDQQRGFEEERLIAPALRKLKQQVLMLLKPP